MIPCSSFDNHILMMVRLWNGYYATLDKIIEMQTRAMEGEMPTQKNLWFIER